ncbi:MAG: Allophanate hydrolase 2 subunit 2 [uncultured Rubrobacteraceae bacterium]|uniref:Allophanate hydrolase 2 subunit 2 n=1 Tax=uncultured Rubrobacteraceae bacterium TaxID=349277 RepID=A0A6J4RTD0_9ACTN|nr:MAG: Allophanate hydrolase 2 subunit 2 [uncultured Rubrobacteraceae bacterium]
MAIRVKSPGLLTTVQDTGRFGEYAIGMPPSGAMDVFSYQVGNYLVGNEDGSAGLEITYFGPELEFTESAVIAVTGAEMPPKINGEEAPTWETLSVEEGDVLSFDYLRNGARSYLAVAGGIDVPVFMHSRSTYTLIGLGGYEGRALQAGDELQLGDARNGDARNGDAQVGKKVDADAIPRYTKETELRVIIGLASYRLTQESMKEFLNVEWTVTPDADRVGYRYRGGELGFVEREQPAGAGSDPANVVDFGYPIGSIQVPGGVEPIVLMNDAVTGGGYATIGTVISADRDRLAQSKTNDKTRFRSIELEEALAARGDRRKTLAEIKDSLA